MARQMRVSSRAAKLGRVPRRGGVRGVIDRARGGQRQLTAKEQTKLELDGLRYKAKAGKLTTAEKARFNELKKGELQAGPSTQGSNGRSDFIARRLAENARALDLAQDHLQGQDFLNASAGNSGEMNNLLAQKNLLNKKQVAVRKGAPKAGAQKGAPAIAKASLKSTPKPKPGQGGFTIAA